MWTDSQMATVLILTALAGLVLKLVTWVLVRAMIKDDTRQH